MRVPVIHLAGQVAEEPLTFDEPLSSLPVVHDARWSAALTEHSLIALIVWIGLLILLQLVCWPLVRRLFPAFPDRGWSLARLTTVLLAGFLTWLPAALHFSTFNVYMCWLSMLLLATICWIVVWKLPDPHPLASSHLVLAGEIVFWVTFAIFLLFRLQNPDSWEPLWGGEKAMEFAHINSILRSAHFPPVDPWYAGGYLNYYYYGSYLMAWLMKFTGIPSEIAFNLALPTVIAMLASGLFSLGAAIATAFRSTLRTSMIGGLAATILGVGIGNMVNASHVLERATDSSPVYNWSYWVWDATRVFPMWIITEFPFFAGLFGDLHAHVIALPITVLVLSVAFSISQMRDLLAPWSIENCASILLPRLIFAGLLLGSLFMTNAWDAPAYAALIAVAVVSAVLQRENFTSRAFASLAAIFIAGTVAIVVTMPFNRYYQALFSEIDEVHDNTPLLPLMAHLGGFLLILTAGFAFITTRYAVTPIRWLNPGFATLITGIVLLLRWTVRDSDVSTIEAMDLLIVLVIGLIWVLASWTLISSDNDLHIPPLVSHGILLAGGLFLFSAFALEKPVFSLYLAIAAASAVAWIHIRETAARFTTGLITTAASLGAGLELFYLVDDLSTIDAYRMNTMFKFYNQIWTLLAVASAACVAFMATHLNERTEAPSNSGATSWARIGLVTASLTVVLGLAYPVTAVPVRLDTRISSESAEYTLNAYNWMSYAQIQLTNGEFISWEDDLAAINWFNESVEGNPVIMEASFGTYRCNGSRFSIATGLPAVIGWQRHEEQQRDRRLLPPRVDDVREFYESEDVATKLAILENYQVEYIIVGQTERVFPVIDGNSCIATDPSAGIAVLESMVGSQLEVAFAHGTTTVYRVLR